MTENRTSKGTGIDAFERMLDTFGSDRTRWPAPARRDFASLTTSGEAGVRLKEAEALDRLLDLAAPPQIDTSALAARIVAAARAEAPATTAAPSGTRFQRRESGRRAAEAPWPAAALLAASLVLGMFAGISGAFQPDVGTAVAESDAGFDSDVDADQLAFDSDRISMFEGDLL
jgi:hypothetical protein